MEANTVYDWFYKFGSRAVTTYENYKNYVADRHNIDRAAIEEFQFPEKSLRIMYNELIDNLVNLSDELKAELKNEIHPEPCDKERTDAKLPLCGDFKLPLKTAKDISDIAAFFDWETAFKIEKMLGNVEDDEEEIAFDEFKSKIMDDVFHFVCDCIKNNHNDYFMEFVHSMRLEYRDGTVTLRYQPVVWDNYD